MSDPVVIIGAGLSGLCCARELTLRGVEVVVLEASDAVGGRVRTDLFEGFRLDRGFQVLLTAYPEAARQLDYSALQLREFDPGSIVRTEQGFDLLCDPWRQPRFALKTALSRIGSLLDKLRIGRLRWDSRRGAVDDAFTLRPDVTTEEELRRLGFSDGMIEKFFRPFLGGVFLERELQTSARMLYYVFRMFSRDQTAVPALGMSAIPAQLADGIPEHMLRLNTRVASIGQGHVELASGERISSESIVVATDQSTAGSLMPELECSRPDRSVSCVYFASSEPPLRDPMLVLNGTDRGLVNNLCVISQVATEYAPEDQSLISISVLGAHHDPKTLHIGVKEEMREWFGRSVDGWSHLRTYPIAHALPNQSPPAFNPPMQPPEIRPNVFVCGDYRVNGSINGAMQSGRLVAESLIAKIQGHSPEPSEIDRLLRA